MKAAVLQAAASKFGAGSAISGSGAVGGSRSSAAAVSAPVDDDNAGSASDAAAGDNVVGHDEGKTASSDAAGASERDGDLSVLDPQESLGESASATSGAASLASARAHSSSSASQTLSDVDRQLQVVAKLCDASFRAELRSSVHGRSRSPMPKLVAASQAVAALRLLVESHAASNSQVLVSGDKSNGASVAVNFSSVEFGCFDLFGSVDGILWKIFSEIGFEERKAVALVSETEWRHAVMNFVVFADFSAIVIGTSVDSHSDAQAALSHPSISSGSPLSRVSLVEEFASKDNVNHIISCLTALRLPRQPVHCTDKGMSGSIDLLLLDVGGGMDYWILDKITEVQPRVIVVKLLAEMGTQAIPLVRPYKMDYSSTLRADRGITILTAAAWAAKNGYRVVGCDSEASHAFLLQDALARAVFPSVDPHACVPKVCAKRGCKGLPRHSPHVLLRPQSPPTCSRKSCPWNGKRCPKTKAPCNALSASL